MCLRVESKCVDHCLYPRHDQCMFDLYYCTVQYTCVDVVCYSLGWRTLFVFTDMIAVQLVLLT